MGYNISSLDCFANEFIIILIVDRLASKYSLASVQR